MRENLFAFVLFAAMLPMGAAQGQPMVQSQEGIALENQILQLQQQVQQLQATSGGGSALGGGGGSSSPAQSGAGTPVAPDSSIVTNLLNQVNQLQSQVQQLNGQVDTLQNQVNTQNAATQKAIGDLNFKVTGSAAPGTPATPSTAVPAAAAAGAAAGAATAKAATPAAPAAPAASAASALSGTPTKILRAGQVAYVKGDYTTAATAARKILATSSTSPEAYQAQYLLAKSLAAQNKPQDAAIAYDDAYNRNRSGPEAAESLLGLANSLSAINQNEAACDTLSSLNSQFPSPSPSMSSRIKSASAKAHCS
jgi:TolA-binding protein